jgi:ribonuclease R
LHIHRLLDDLLNARKPRMHMGELVVLGQHCSDREQRATAAERDLTNLKLLAYLSDQVGLEMDGLVTGVENFGLFVQGVDLPAEGLIRTESLADDYYTFDRATHSLTGRRFGNRYRLGDRLRVVVTRVDPLRRELDFRLHSREKDEPERFKPRGGGPEKKASDKRKAPGKNDGKRRKKKRE